MSQYMRQFEQMEQKKAIIRDDIKAERIALDEEEKNYINEILWPVFLGTVGGMVLISLILFARAVIRARRRRIENESDFDFLDGNEDDIRAGMKKRTAKKRKRRGSWDDEAMSPKGARIGGLKK